MVSTSGSEGEAQSSLFALKSTMGSFSPSQESGIVPRVAREGVEDARSVILDASYNHCFHRKVIF